MLEKMIRVRLVEIHREFDVDYSSYSLEWKTWVEKLAWNSINGMANVRNITIDEAIDHVL